jgi:hypothetical protein
MTTMASHRLKRCSRRSFRRRKERLQRGCRRREECSRGRAWRARNSARCWARRQVLHGHSGRGLRLQTNGRCGQRVEPEGGRHPHHGARNRGERPD